MKRPLLVISIIAMALAILYAASPAGVSGVELWMHTAPATNNLLSEYRWQDESGDSLMHGRVRLDDVVEPYSKRIDSVRHINFRPAMHVRSSDSSWVGFTRTDLNQYTSFGVWIPDEPNECHISAAYCSTAPNFSSWGRPNDHRMLFPGVRKNFSGYCPELMVYGRVLTPYERKRIESFMAMRYGITMQHSYFVGDTLLWDAHENPYHNNVAAIGFDSQKRFRQLKSSSLHNLSRNTFVAIDSYYASNPYGMSSDSLLLTIGYGDDCLIPDGQYIMWGDDNGVLRNSAHRFFPSITLLERTWRSRSTDVAPTPVNVDIRGENMSVLRLPGSRYAMLQTLPDRELEYTTDFSNGDGFFSFRQRFVSGTFDVAFVNPADKSARFGFRFNPDSTIARIDGSRILSVDTMFRHFNQKVSIERKGDCVRLRIDNLGDSTLTVCSPSVRNASMLCVQIPAQPSGSKYGAELTDVAIGGISYTGQQVELSYDQGGFGLVPDRNTAMFVRSEDDIFVNNPDTLDYSVYYSAEVDTLRRKVIFDSVRLNSESQTEYFTFAQIDSLYASAEIIYNAIDVDVKYGIPPFRVALCRFNEDGTERDRYEKITYTRHASLTGIYNTSDSMFVSEEGWRVYAIGDSSVYRVLKSRDQNNHTGVIYCNLPKVLQPDQSFRIGFSRGSIVDYGMAVEDGVVKIVVDGDCFANSNLASAVSNSHLVMTYDESGMSWIVDDNVIYSSKIKDNFFAMIEAKQGEVYLDGVIFDGYSDEFDLSPGFFVYPTHGRWYKIPLEVATEPTRSPDGNPVPSMSKSREGGMDDDFSNRGLSGSLYVSRENNNGMNFRAICNVADAAQASFVVFDAVGRMVYREELPCSGQVTAVRFSVPSPGGYVAKLITDNSEFTQKFIAN